MYSWRVQVTSCSSIKRNGLPNLGKGGSIFVSRESRQVCLSHFFFDAHLVPFAKKAVLFQFSDDIFCTCDKNYGCFSPCIKIEILPSTFQIMAAY